VELLKIACTLHRFESAKPEYEAEILYYSTAIVDDGVVHRLLPKHENAAYQLWKQEI
jgi:hypothetical protein